jgi:hypothetical protein
LKEARAGGNNLWPSGFLGHKDSLRRMQDNDDDVEKGSRALRMQTSGWLNTSVDGLPDVDKDRLMPSVRPRIEWINIVKH